MRYSLSDTTMDARRSIGLLIAVAGPAVVSIGIAASPVSPFAGLQGGAFGIVLPAVERSERIGRTVGRC